MPDAELFWYREHTINAPALLRARAEECLLAVPDGGRVSRLAVAGEQALAAAIAAGEERAAALDLLAADALITLALLAQAEGDPAGLGDAARELRLRAIA